MSIIIGLNPYLETPFRIPWYAVLLVIGLTVGIAIAFKLSRKYDLSTSYILPFLFAAIIGGLIGARLFHVADYLDYYLANPGLIPLIWLGGLSQYGAIIGGLSTTLFYAWCRKLSFLRFLDLVSVPTMIGFSIGRIGCIIQGCCYGSKTDLPWGFVYTHPNSLIVPELRGVPVHPTQVYEIIYFMVLAGIFWGLGKYLHPIRGLSFLFFLIGHSVKRFFIFFLRGDYPELQIVAGLTQAQIIALIILFISVPLLVIYRRQGKSFTSP